MINHKWYISKQICPVKASCHAIITKYDYIHFFEYEGQRRHYSIHISSIIHGISNKIVNNYLRTQTRLNNVLMPKEMNELILKWFGSMDVCIQ